jgi:CP family cyanate transporter-like MFS transporter
MQRYPWIILGCISMTVLLLYVLMQCVSPLLPTIILEFQVDHSAGGFLYVIPIMMVALLTYPLGVGSDYLGSTKALYLGASIAVLASLLRAVAPDFSYLMLFTAIFGLGFALYFPNLSKTVKEQFPANMVGKATAVYTAAIPFGSGLGISLSKPILEMAGSWRSVLETLTAIAIVLIGLTGVVLHHVRRRKPISVSKVQRPLPAGHMNSISIEPTENRSFLPILICGLLLGLLNFIFFITIGWLPTYLADSGWAPVSAGAVTSIISFVEIPAILLYPYLAEWTGRERLLILISFLLISLCSLAVSLDPSWAWIVSPVLGITFGGTFVLLVAFPAQFSPRNKVGRAAGASLSIGYLGALLGPPIAGRIRDLTGDFSLAFLVSAAVGVAAMGLSFAFPQSHHSCPNRLPDSMDGG